MRCDKAGQAPLRAMKSGKAEEHGWRPKGLADGEILGLFKKTWRWIRAGRRLKKIKIKSIRQKACVYGGGLQGLSPGGGGLLRACSGKQQRVD